jgi:hypothetical protein
VAASAAELVARLGSGPAAAWEGHDTCIRIAFALNNIARGTDILLDPFIQLVSSSSKAQANVAEWATGLYHAPPPAGGGSRPGLAFLQKLVGEKEAEAKAEERTALQEILRRAGCPDDDRFIDGIEAGHMLLLGKFLAAQSLRDYRVALDVVQHDKPGCPHGHVLYKNDGALWVYQAACKLNYVDDMVTELLSTLKTVVAVPAIQEGHPRFWAGANELRENLLCSNGKGWKPIEVRGDALATRTCLLTRLVPATHLRRLPRNSCETTIFTSKMACRRQRSSTSCSTHATICWVSTMA